jgi:cyclophilin family peptidyl-prolyl cis-trans isomerase
MTQGSTPPGRRAKNLRGGARRGDPRPPVRARDLPSSRAARTQRLAAGRAGTDPRLLAAAGLGAVLLVIGIVLGGGFLGGGSDCPTSQPPALAAGETHRVGIETSLGTFTITVDGSLSPIAAGNFVALASCGFYDGVVFHRIATLQDGTPFVIQGGDPTGTGNGGPGYTIRDEPVTATYHRGTVAMARGQDPNSQGSQFFIVLDDRDADVLSSANTYAIFGEVTSGMDVVDAIYEAANGVENPTDPIAMTRVIVDSASPQASVPPSQ